MSNPSGWLFLAEEDLKTAKAVLKEDIPSMAAFHAQQATEKSLKGYLISQEKRIRKTHDLSALLEETGLEDFKQECRFLNKFYAATRYPDIIPGSLEDALPTTEQAKQAVEHAEEIFSFNCCSSRSFLFGIASLKATTLSFCNSARRTKT